MESVLPVLPGFVASCFLHNVRSWLNEEVKSLQVHILSFYSILNLNLNCICLQAVRYEGCGWIQTGVSEARVGWQQQSLLTVSLYNKLKCSLTRRWLFAVTPVLCVICWIIQVTSHMLRIYIHTRISLSALLPKLILFPASPAQTTLLLSYYLSLTQQNWKSEPLSPPSEFRYWVLSCLILIVCLYCILCNGVIGC